MDKVKYTRKEYREEYLKSPEWKELRDTIMAAQPDCQCCSDVKASDPHHMVYRNIVDVKASDILPVCRKCHDLIHQAISDRFISQDPEEFEEIRRKTLDINGEEYLKYRDWLTSKHYLGADRIQYILQAPPYVLRRVSGVKKKVLEYSTIRMVKFSGRQLLKIDDIIKSSKNQSKDKGPLKTMFTSREEYRQNCLKNEHLKSLRASSSRRALNGWEVALINNLSNRRKNRLSALLGVSPTQSGVELFEGEIKFIVSLCKKENQKRW